MLSLRAAKIEDRDRIYAVHTSAILGLCITSYSEESVKQWAGRQTPSQYVPSIEAGEITLAVTAQEEVVGFGHLIRGCKLDCGKTCEIKWLFVSPQWAGKGVGCSLLLHMEEQAREGGCSKIHVKSSLNAKGFYEKMGYSVVDASDVHVCCEQTLQCISMNKDL